MKTTLLARVGLGVFAALSAFMVLNSIAAGGLGIMTVWAGFFLVCCVGAIEALTLARQAVAELRGLRQDLAARQVPPALPRPASAHTATARH